jgi:hypothetical protein
MFVALFPFSEVVYIIAICLAWVYIALGIMGSNQAAEADTTALNIPDQVQYYQLNENITIDERTCFWNNFEIISEISPDTKYHIFLPVSSIVFLERRTLFPPFYLSSGIPSRAPPAV